MALEWDDAPAAAAPTVHATRRPAWTLTSGERIGSADRVMFTERLTLLLETGVPLHDALRALHEQAGKPRLKAIVGEVADDIVGGQRFSEALARSTRTCSRRPTST
jgi:type II secretory pathway component PulF